MHHLEVWNALAISIYRCHGLIAHMRPPFHVELALWVNVHKWWLALHRYHTVTRAQEREHRSKYEEPIEVPGHLLTF